jgi:hypothetical protein
LRSLRDKAAVVRRERKGSAPLWDINQEFHDRLVKLFFEARRIRKASWQARQERPAPRLPDVPPPHQMQGVHLMSPHPPHLMQGVPPLMRARRPCNPCCK